MKMRGTFYVKFAGYLLIAVALAHLVMHFSTNKPANNKEAVLFRLMEDYHKPIPGGSMSVKKILDGLNVCYALFLFSSGCTYLMIIHSGIRPLPLSKLAAFGGFLFIGLALVAVIYFAWIHILYFLTVAAWLSAAAVRLLSEKE